MISFRGVYDGRHYGFQQEWHLNSLLRARCACLEVPDPVQSRLACAELAVQRRDQSTPFSDGEREESGLSVDRFPYRELRYLWVRRVGVTGICFQ